MYNSDLTMWCIEAYNHTHTNTQWHTHTHLYRHTCMHIHTHTPVQAHLYTHTHTPVKSRHSDGPRSSCSRWLCCDGWTDSHFYSAAGRSPAGRRVWQHAVSVVLTPLQTLQKTGTGSQSPFSWCGAPEEKKARWYDWFMILFFNTMPNFLCLWRTNEYSWYLTEGIQFVFIVGK